MKIVSLTPPNIANYISDIDLEIKDIANNNADPSIILFQYPRTSLSELFKTYPLDINIIKILLTTFSGTSVTIKDDTEFIDLEMIAGTLMKNASEISTAANSVMKLKGMSRDIVDPEDSTYATNLEEISNSIMRVFENNKLPETQYYLDTQKPICIHESIPNDAFSSIMLYNVYSYLKQSFNILRIPLNQDSILGAIAYRYWQYMNAKTRSKDQKLLDAISAAKLKDSTFDGLVELMDKFEIQGGDNGISSSKLVSACNWYIKRLKFKIFARNFYYDALSSLMDMNEAVDSSPIMENFRMYDLDLDSERITIRPKHVDNKRFDIVDFIAESRTSVNLPLIIGKVNDQIIIKSFNSAPKHISWYENIKNNTMRIYIKISKNPEKYHYLDYDLLTNQFYIMRRDKYISVNTMLSILESHVPDNIITIPLSYLYTYTFVTNYIVDNANDNIGIDRSILAWIITNPPEDYRTKIINNEYVGPCVDQYWIIKEDNKPDALKDHISVHIQIGMYKMYLSISTKDSTSSGTIVPTLPGEDMTSVLVGFQSDQKIFRVKINRCPNIEYAYICQQIYKHIIYMYMKYYHRVKAYLLEKYMVELSTIYEPKILPLNQITPSNKNAFSFEDSQLYKLILSESQENLPVPIKRNEVDHWISQKHTVMKLPTVVVNDSTVTFDVEGEIWIRTPQPGYFELRPKTVKKMSATNGLYDSISYIPIYSVKETSLKVITAHENPDMLWKCYIEYSTKSQRYQVSRFSIKNSLKYGATAQISETISEIVKQIAEYPYISATFIPQDVLFSINNFVFGGNTSYKGADLSKHAYLCMQECPDQTIEEISDDLKNGKVSYLKHWRALEALYNVNIYFMSGNDGDIFHRTPHSSLYIHRTPNKFNPAILFYIVNGICLLISESLDTNGTDKNRLYVFSPFTRANGKISINPVTELEKLMEKTKQYSVADPVYGTVNKVNFTPNYPTISGWNVIKQYVDAEGKTRGLVYNFGAAYATLDIGISHILPNIPVTKSIVAPTMYQGHSGSSPYILQSTELFERDDISKRILYPSPKNSFSDWRTNEKNARLLCMISSVIFSYSNLPAMEFSNKHIIVKNNLVSYGNINLPHSTFDLWYRIIQKETPRDVEMQVWQYFSGLAPLLVSCMDTCKIYVSNDATKVRLTNYLMALGKHAIEYSFKDYIKYTWDISSNDSETVYLSVRDAIQKCIIDGSKSSALSVVNEIVWSIQPYLIERDSKYYLVQSCVDELHTAFVCKKWIAKRINPGYFAHVPSYINAQSINKYSSVSQNFVSMDYDVAYCVFNNTYYAILKI